MAPSPSTTAVTVLLITAVVALTASVLFVGTGQGLHTRDFHSGTNTANANGYLSSITGCRYTDSRLPQLIADLKRYVDHDVWGNYLFAYVGGTWKQLITEFNDQETPYVNNTYLNTYVESLRTRTLAVIKDTRNTLEKAQLRLFLIEIEKTLNLTKLDTRFMQYGIYWWDWGWENDPYMELADVITRLVTESATFIVEPDYAVRVLQLLQSAKAKFPRWRAQAERAAAACKTHAGLVASYQFDLGYGPYGHKFAYSINYTGLCLETFGGATTTQQTACATVAAELETLQADYLDWWNSTYIPRAVECRPDSAPGLWNASADGPETYRILQRYHLGAAINVTEVYQLGQARIAEVLTQYDTLRTQMPAPPIADRDALIAALADPNDTRFSLCTDNPEDVKRLVREILQDNEARSAAYFAFGPRSVLRVDNVSNSGYFFQNSNYDRTRRFWPEGNIVNIAPDAACGVNDSKLSFSLTELRAILMHEGRPGHGLQVPLGIEVDGSFLGQLTGDTYSVEGWGLHAEHLGVELGIYGDSPIDLLGYYKSRALRDNRLREGTCLHGSATELGRTPCNVSEAIAMQQETGSTLEYSETEARRYIAQPGQELSYMLGNLDIIGIRNATAAAVLANTGEPMEPREFYNFLRFGVLHVRFDLAPFMQTLVKHLSHQPITEADYASDLIPSQLYTSGNPIVGLGC